MTPRSILTAGLLPLVMATAAAFAGGRLYETSFEEGTDRPTGWTPPAKAEQWRWENEGHTGKRCVSLIGDSDEESAMSWVSDLIALEPNRLYCLRFWYKCEHEKKSRGPGMGPKDVRIAFPYSPEWKEGKIFWWVPTHVKNTQLEFHLYHAKAKLFLDDVSIESVAVAYLQQEGLVLSGFEKIEKGNYVFNWGFSPTTTTNICRVVERNTSNYMDQRIRFNKDHEVILKFQLGRFDQLSGKLFAKLCYYIDGDAVFSASRDGKAWTEIGRLSDTPKIEQSSKSGEFQVPDSVYPANALFLRILSTGVLQISGFRYEAKLGGSPPDMVGRTSFYQGHLLEVNSGPLLLRFDQSSPLLAQLRFRDKPIGSVGCRIAQFEKEGIGYKGVGIDSSDPTGVKAIEVKKKDPTECVVEVTAERAESAPATRTFEAKYRFTIYAGQAWLKSELVSVKNTDSVGYTLKGYYHSLNAASDLVAPVCYPNSAGWIAEDSILGAVSSEPDAFTLALRKTEEGRFGDLTRRLDAVLQPGMTWEGNEPEIVLFVCPGGEPAAVHREAVRILGLVGKPPGEVAQGQIAYEEQSEQK